jgi:hypothetical protein
VVIGTRLKRAGMHRTVCGANAIIALRCSKLSGRYEDFWERRSDRAAACLKTQVQLCIVSFIPLLVRTRTAVALFDRADVAPPLGRNRALLCLPGRDPASGIHHQQRESLNMSLRKVIKTRGSFPGEEAAVKLLYLALRNVSKKWKASRDWRVSLNHFTLLWGDRIETAQARPSR